MVAVLLGSLAFTAWMWLAPYEWNADPGARFRIEAVHLERDRSYHWLQVHLKARGEEGHDWSQPVFLEAAGVRYEPADVTLSGEEGGRQELWLKFWLEGEEVEGSLMLHLNGGSLVVKSSGRPVKIEGEGSKVFRTKNW